MLGANFDFIRSIALKSLVALTIHSYIRHPKTEKGAQDDKDGDVWSASARRAATYIDDSLFPRHTSALTVAMLGNDYLLQTEISAALARPNSEVGIGTVVGDVYDDGGVFLPCGPGDAVKSPATMTAKQINDEIDSLDVASSEITDRFIAARRIR